MRSFALWSLALAGLLVPVALASQSPFLAWRDPTYIIAGFAGIVAFALMMLQPMLAVRWMPGLAAHRALRWHRILGLMIVGGVGVHVAGLWITSPPDVVDVLLLRSPTPFAIWGLAAMWAIVLTPVLLWFRERRTVGPAMWRILHTLLFLIAVFGTALHALLIEGAMEPISKAVLCAMVAGGTLAAVIRRKAWTAMRRSRSP